MGHGHDVRPPYLSIRFLFALRQVQLFPRTILTLRVNGKVLHLCNYRPVNSLETRSNEYLTSKIFLLTTLPGPCYSSPCSLAETSLTPSVALVLTLDLSICCSLLLSFFDSDPLLSTACSLFSQNTRGRGTSAKLPFRISNFQPLFSHSVCNLVTPPVCPAISPRFGVSAAIALLPLCFHTLTNSFSRNSFIFKSIQIPRGV
jgi:hypothetical protein